MGKLRSSSLTALALVVWMATAAVGQAAVGAGAPMQVIQTSNEAIQAVLAEHDPLDPEGEAKVYEIMDGITDFRRMSDDAIEGICEDTAQKCDEWKSVFSDLLRIRSIKGLGRYRADRFDYLNEEIDGERAVVKTLAYFEGDDVTLDYELELIGERWVIVNYVVDDVDTARSYRRRFVRLLRDESVDAVIQRLRDRILEYQQES